MTGAACARGVAFGALVALVVAGAAAAAYTSPRLSVTYAGSVTRIVASSSAADQATARAAIYVPAGTTIAAPAAPGTKVGTVAAQVVALALGSTQATLTGDVLVAPAPTAPSPSQAACLGTETPTATLVLALQVSGQRLDVSTFLVPTVGAEATLGPAKLVVCLPPPDVPEAAGGAPYGVKLLSADLSLTGLFGRVAAGAWIGVWTPWQAGTGQLDTAATVATPAVVAPGSVTLAGRKAQGRRVLAGTLRQGGVGFAGRVQIWGAPGKAALRPLATVRSSAKGTFTYSVPRASKATTFQARVVAPSRGAPAGCASLPALPAPCVNPTVRGFTAQSRTVTLR